MIALLPSRRHGRPTCWHAVVAVDGMRLDHVADSIGEPVRGLLLFRMI